MFHLSIFNFFLWLKFKSLVRGVSFEKNYSHSMDRLLLKMIDLQTAAPGALFSLPTP